jgi:O-antigen/teichoic acid export membrane protein
MQRQGKHILSHTGIYLVARGVPGLMAFLAIPLFTRWLSPAQYGRYGLVIATAGLLNALVFQWIRLSLVRYLPAYKDDPSALKSTMMTLTVQIIGVLGVIAAILTVLPIHSEWKAVALPCWIMLGAQGLFELSCENARAMLRPWSFMWLQVAKSTGAVCLGMGLIILGAGWWGPLAGATAGMLLAVAFAFGRDWKQLRWSVDPAIFRQIARYGLPLSMTVALANVIGSSDRYLIAVLNSDKGAGLYAAGLYSVAVDFTTQTLTLVMMVVNLAMFPLAVRAFESHGKEAAQEQMRSNASLLLAIGVPCVLGMTVLAPGIANCFIGKEYRTTAASIIPLIALGAFLAGFKAYHFDAAFQFAHRTIYQVWIVMFVAVVNIALNWLAIPRYGINGAAGASVMAYVLSIGLTAWLGRRHFVLPFPVMPCAKVLAAGGLMAAALYPFRGDRRPVMVAMQILAGGVIYCGTLVAVNFLEVREMAMQSWKKRNIPTGFPVVFPGSSIGVTNTDAEVGVTLATDALRE